MSLDQLVLSCLEERGGYAEVYTSGRFYHHHLYVVTARDDATRDQTIFLNQLIAQLPYLKLSDIYAVIIDFLGKELNYVIFMQTIEKDGGYSVIELASTSTKTFSSTGKLLKSEPNDLPHPRLFPPPGSQWGVVNKKKISNKKLLTAVEEYLRADTSSLALLQSQNLPIHRTSSTPSFVPPTRVAFQPLPPVPVLKKNWQYMLGNPAATVPSNRQYTVKVDKYAKNKELLYQQKDLEAKLVAERSRLQSTMNRYRAIEGHASARMRREELEQQVGTLHSRHSSRPTSSANSYLGEMVPRAASRESRQRMSSQGSIYSSSTATNSGRGNRPLSHSTIMSQWADVEEVRAPTWEEKEEQEEIRDAMREMAMVERMTSGKNRRRRSLHSLEVSAMM